MSAGFRLALFRRIEEVQEYVAFVRLKTVRVVSALVVAPHEDVAAGLFERFGEAHAVGFCGNHGVGAAVHAKDGDFRFGDFFGAGMVDRLHGIVGADIIGGESGIELGEILPAFGLEAGQG